MFGFDTPPPVPQLHLRLESNAVDFDLVTNHDAARLGGPSWTFGYRVASRFLDSGTALPQQSSSLRYQFVGAGPHLGVGKTLPVGRTGWGFFAHAEAAFLLGGESNTSLHTEAASTDPFFPRPAVSERDATPWTFRTTADAAVRAGVSYTGTFAGGRIAVGAQLGVQAEVVGFAAPQLIHFAPPQLPFAPRAGDSYLLDGVYGVTPYLRCEIAF